MAWLQNSKNHSRGLFIVIASLFYFVIYSFYLLLCVHECATCKERWKDDPTKLVSKSYHSTNMVVVQINDSSWVVSYFSFIQKGSCQIKTKLNIITTTTPAEVLPCRRWPILGIVPIALLSVTLAIFQLTHRTVFRHCMNNTSAYDRVHKSNFTVC